jgi:hypothetical protein
MNCTNTFCCAQCSVVVYYTCICLLSKCFTKTFITLYFPLIDWLIIYGFTSRSRIFHLYGDVTIAGEGLQNLGLCSALRAFEQGGIFIVPHLLWHGTSVSPVSSEGPPPFSRLLRHTRRCGGSILTRIPTGSLNKEYINKEYILTNASTVHAVVLSNTSTQFRRSGQISHYRIFMIKYRVTLCFTLIFTWPTIMCYLFIFMRVV